MNTKIIKYIGGAVVLGLCMVTNSMSGTGTQNSTPETSLAGMSLLLDQYSQVNVSSDEELLSFLSNPYEDENKGKTEKLYASDKGSEKKTESEAETKETEESEPETESLPEETESVEETEPTTEPESETEPATETETQPETTVPETTVPETTVPETTPEQTEPETTEAPKQISIFDTIAIANVENYVNVRSTPSTTEENIVGRIYPNCAAFIKDVVNGEGGQWYQIESGNVQGYIKAQYFLVGEEAEKVAEQIGAILGTVNSDGLRVREIPTLDASGKVFTMLPLGSQVVVLEQGPEWDYVQVDDDVKGYAYASCLDVTVKFDTAKTNEEIAAIEAEKRRLEEEARAAEEARQKALEEQRKAEEAARQAAEAARQAEEAAKRAAAEQAAQKAAQEEQARQQELERLANNEATNTANDVKAQTRAAICAYAIQFQGGPYVYGGTNLTGGIDCSGFTMKVYEHFNISLPHHSGSQLACGARITDYSQLLPGDLVFYNAYDGGPITHVALYIGNGQIVHASNEKYGICVWSVYYRTPCAACRIIQ